MRDDDLHVSIAFEPEITEELKTKLEEKWGEPRKVGLKSWMFGSGGSAVLHFNDSDIGNCPCIYEAQA